MRSSEPFVSQQLLTGIADLYFNISFFLSACKKWHISQREESFDESEPEEEGKGIGESADPQGTENDLSSLDR